MAEAKYEPRLKTEYMTRIRKALQEQFSYANEMQIPRLDKIVINMGVGEATADSKKPTVAAADLAAIAGQKPVITRHAIPSPASSSAKTCRSARRSPCAAPACMNSWTA